MAAAGSLADPRSRQGRVYPLACLIAVAVYACTAAGHDRLTAVGQWARRASQADLARLRAPWDPIAGRYRVPDEKAIRKVLDKLDPRAPEQGPPSGRAVGAVAGGLRPACAATRPGDHHGRVPDTATLLLTATDDILGTHNVRSHHRGGQAGNADPSQWRAQLHNLLERVRTELVTHPGMAAATMVDPPRTEVAMRLLENLLGILLAGGLDAQDAAWAADTFAAQVTYAAIEAELRRTDPSALAAEITANFARLAADDFPLITAHAAELVAGDADERFRFAIDVVIDGVLSRASRR